jgi:phage antirepressor YoqD-like protein
MNELIAINGIDIQVVEFNGERVLTTEQLAHGYECEPQQIQQNFNNNKERFVEGKHFYKLEGEELRRFKNYIENIEVVGVGKRAPHIYLWTKRGAARHSKMLGTDRAWDMFDLLEESYFNGNRAPSYQITDPIARAEAWIEEQKQIQALKVANKQQEQIIGELKPKADYTDTILRSKDTVPITSIAKDYGMSGKSMNKILHELGVIYRTAGQWLLYAKYQAKGYTHSKTIEYHNKQGDVAGSTMYTEWTQKGRLFLYQLLKENGVLPMIEKQEIALPF